MDRVYINGISEHTMLEPWLSVEELAKYLGISKETIYRWLEKGTIPSHRIGKLWKFKPSEVDRWIRAGGANSKQHENTRQQDVT
jgi:excisionase family DNA binding protein